MAVKYAKAYLLTEGGSRLPCWFNPPSLTVSRTGDWKRTAIPGRQVPLTEYRGGRADCLSLTLLLHATDEKSAPDVRNRINQFYGLLNPKKQGKTRLQRPPLVQFVWGSYVSFVAICKSVKVTTELFDAEGTPMRALVDLVLEQYQNEPGTGMRKPQNPTTQATGRYTSHRIEVGDSLASIAWEHYKDATRWREIAAFNAIDDPLRLACGAILMIPTGER